MRRKINYPVYRRELSYILKKDGYWLKDPPRKLIHHHQQVYIRKVLAPSEDDSVERLLAWFKANNLYLAGKL